MLSLLYAEFVSACMCSSNAVTCTTVRCSVWFVTRMVSIGIDNASVNSRFPDPADLVQLLCMVLEATA